MTHRNKLRKACTERACFHLEQHASIKFPGNLKECKTEVQNLPTL